MTINELYSEFLTKYMEMRLRETTIRGYRTNIEKHTLPYFDGLDISDITVDKLDMLTAKLMHTLSNRSIVYVHATLRKMLSYAIKRGYISQTPYTMFDMPRVKKYHHRVLDREQMSLLLKVCKGTEIEVSITLALRYGMRRGECLGVIVEKDLDRFGRVLHVQRTRTVEHGVEVCTPCKTEKSNRYVLLSHEDTEWLYGFQNGSEYVCRISPHMLDKSFKKLLKENELPSIRFHDLRHTYATFMLGKGINAKIVSEILGHANVGVTLDIYSHPDVRMQEVCVQAMAGI